MAIDTDQLDDLLKRADRHQARLISALATLEQRVVDLLAQAPLQDGNLFDLTWAVQARAPLRQAIDQEYLTVVNGIIGEYAEVADEVATMLAEYGDIATLDPSVVSQLQELTFSGFEDLGQEYLDVISKQVYESTLTGTSFADSVQQVQKAVGGDMARYASQQVHDSLTQFDAAINAKIGLDSGATRWQYRGSKDGATRDHCEKHVNKTYTLDEMYEIWQGEWAGKSGSDPFINRGGFNCRHRWRPVFD
ncbi:MAG: hypothetical protein ACPHNW_11450 [Pseudoalteromonas tetraodonis]